MKKALLSVISSLFFVIAMPAFAQLGQPVPTVTTTPQPALPPQVSHGPVNFFGEWVLAFYNGSRIDPRGATPLPYSEMHVTFHGGQVNSDGSRQYYGTVDGEYGSSVTVFTNPSADRQYAQVFVYVPDMEFGTTNQYTSTECKLFVAPKGNDYLHGTMSAIQQSTGWNGNWMTRSLYTGQVDFFPSQAQTAPMIGDAPAGSGGGKG